MWLQKYRFESYYLPFLQNSFLSNIYIELIKLTKLKKKFIKSFFKKKYTSLIYIEYEFSDSDFVKLTRYIRYFYRNIWLKVVIQNLPIVFKKTNLFYNNFLSRFYIYNYIKLDFWKLVWRYWINFNIKSLTFIFPFNSRYKFSYEAELHKIFLTLSAGILLKLFNIFKKSTKQHKKVFKLGLLFLKNVIIHPQNIFLMLVFKTLHKNIFLFLKLIHEHFDFKQNHYFVLFKFKKYNHFIYFKKKRSIKKKIQKRLLLLK